MLIADIFIAINFTKHSIIKRQIENIEQKYLHEIILLSPLTQKQINY